MHLESATQLGPAFDAGRDVPCTGGLLCVSEPCSLHTGTMGFTQAPSGGRWAVSRQEHVEQAAGPTPAPSSVDICIYFLLASGGVALWSPAVVVDLKILRN